MFLDRAGGLVAFPKGKGGIFLNQIKFMQDEPLEENDGKKVALTGTILQNMGIGTGSSRVAVPGVNLEYQTLDISVVGHTDRVGSKSANLRLSLARARRVKALLTAAGLDAAILEVTSHGEANPLVHTADEVAEPQNRRVEVTIREP